MFGVNVADQKESAFKPSMFDKPGAKNEESDEDGAAEEPDEAPIYAEGGNANIKFKSGVEIQKSPYSKVIEVRTFQANPALVESCEVQDCDSQGKGKKDGMRDSLS